MGDKELAQGQLDHMVGQIWGVEKLAEVVESLKGDVADRETLKAAMLDGAGAEDGRLTDGAIEGVLAVFDDLPSAEELNDGVSVADLYFSDCLEIYFKGRKSLNGGTRDVNEWDITTVGALLGYGGPTIRAEVRNESNYLNISVAWGEYVEEMVRAPHLAGYLWGLEEFA